MDRHLYIRQGHYDSEPGVGVATFCLAISINIEQLRNQEWDMFLDL